jgi:hypothetical protein
MGADSNLQRGRKRRKKNSQDDFGNDHHKPFP